MYTILKLQYRLQLLNYNKILYKLQLILKLSIDNHIKKSIKDKKMLKSIKKTQSYIRDFLQKSFTVFSMSWILNSNNAKASV